MTDPLDIIGLASAFLASNVDLGDNGEMRAIAQALLAQEEKLKIATEALEYYVETCPHSKYDPHCECETAKAALSRLRSQPSSPSA